MAELKGTIKTIGEVQHITDMFKKVELIINTGGEYPKEVCIEYANKNADKLEPFGEGQEVLVTYDPESREHKGRWYTSLRGWKIVGNL